VRAAGALGAIDDPQPDLAACNRDLFSYDRFRQHLDGEPLPLSDPDLIRVFVNGEPEAKLPLEPLARPGDTALFVKGWESMSPRGYKVLSNNFRAWEDVPP
jgi:hypothetical protein